MNRRSFLLKLGAVLILTTLASTNCLIFAHARTNPQNYIQEYAVPTSNSAPLAITVDANGKVWFTESNASKLASFDPENHTFQEYRTPGIGDMWGVIADPRGYIWFTQYAGRGSVNPGGAIVGGGNGSITQFSPLSKRFKSIPIPTLGSFPMRLTMDRQGQVWFTEFLGNKIGSYDPSTNSLREYVIPTNSSGPADLTFDSHGILWFTEAYAQQVGTFNPETRTFKEYHIGAETVSQIVSSPVGIAIDHDGNVWVADHGGNWIVEFNPETQTTVKYPTHFPPEDVYPISLVNDLLIDSRGYVWFAEHAGNSIGYYAPQTRTMVEFPILTGPISTTLWLTLAPNDDVWFAEWSGNNIGVLHTNLSIPLSIHTSISSLILNQGQEVSIPIQFEILGGTNGNGTMRYAWGSYNPNDVSGTFSTPYPSLASPTELPDRARISVCSETEPGNYTLAVGIETQTVNVWTMVSVTIIKPNTSSRIPLYLMLIAVALVVILYLVLRRRRSNKTN